MKQVININFHGRVVPIEVTAFDLLKSYTESLSRHFANEEGKEEIINDIENRIAELFQERLKDGVTCITDMDVQAVINSIGRPEDFDADEPVTSAAGAKSEHIPSMDNSLRPKRLYRDENDKVIGGVCSGIANYLGMDVAIVRIIFVLFGLTGFGFVTYLVLWVAVPSSALNIIGGVRKKLYRDPDEKIIAGVGSGIANYFGINPWIPRVLFLLPFISFLFKWGDGDFSHILRFGFPGGLIVYIILWLVLPEANTTAEKLEMKGEKVDLNSIKNSVVEEMKGVQQRADKFRKEATTVAQEKGRTFSREVGGAARRGTRSLGDVIALLFKIFIYFILGCIGFTLVLALFAMAIVSIGLFPLKTFVLTDGWQNVFAWGTLIFFIAVPIIGIITWLIRRVAKIKTRRKLMRLSFLGLWVIGVFCFISLIVTVGSDFRSTSSLNEVEVTLSNPSVEKLELTTIEPGKKYFNHNWFIIEPFANIVEDTAYVANFSVHILKSPTDSFRVTMLKVANGRNKRYADTLASMIGFNIAQKDSVLYFDKGISINKNDKFRNQNIIVTVYVPVGKRIRIDRSIERNGNVSFNGPWSHNISIDYDDEENGWETDINYIMKADGLYTLDGEPADQWKHGNKKSESYDENGTGNDNYRYHDSSTPHRLDSIEKQMLDSIRAKDKRARKEYENTDSLKSERSEAMIFSLPAYNPMMIMN